MIRVRLLLLVLLTILALSAYDIVRAATVRCVRPRDERRVLTVGEMDVLSNRVDFALAPITHVVSARKMLVLRGSSYDIEHGRPPAAVLAIVDDARVITASQSRASGRFSLALNLTPGRHEVRFEIVASDLTGYYEPQKRLTVLAR